MFKIIGGDGKEYGPVDAAQIQQWIRDRRVIPQTLGQAVGTTDWKPLSAFPELALPAASPPPPPPAFGAQPITSTPPPTYLLPAILTTLLCCLPFGVPALVYAAQVSSKVSAGDLAGAQKASANARTWCWVAFGAGALWAIIVSLIAGSFGMALPFSNLF